MLTFFSNSVYDHDFSNANRMVNGVYSGDTNAMTNGCGNGCGRLDDVQDWENVLLGYENENGYSYEHLQAIGSCCKIENANDHAQEIQARHIHLDVRELLL